MKASGQAVTDIHGSFFFYAAGFNQLRVKIETFLFQSQSRNLIQKRPLHEFVVKETTLPIRRSTELTLVRFLTKLGAKLNMMFLAQQHQ